MQMEDVIPQLRQRLAMYDLPIMMERIFIETERKAYLLSAKGRVVSDIWQ